MQQKMEISRSWLKKMAKPSLILLGIALVTLAILLLALALFSNYYRGLVLPFTTYAGVNLGGKTQNDAEALILARWEEIKETPIKIRNVDTITNFTLDQLGIELLVPDSVSEKLKTYSADEPVITLVKSVWQQNVLPVRVKTNEDQAIGAIKAVFNDLNYVENAYFKYTSDGAIMIAPERSGVEINREKTRSALLSALINNNPIELNLVEATPTLTSQDLMANQDNLLPKLQREISLTKGADVWRLSSEEIVSMARFEHKKATNGLSSELKISFDPKLWADYEKEHLIPTVNRAPDPISLKLAGEQVEFTGNGRDGEMIDSIELYTNLTEKLNTLEDALTPIIITTTAVPAEIEIDEALRTQGVSGLIATGYTTYYGSPANRTHNVATGLKKFNGMIIQPGETFSFNDNLGPVEAYTGYLPELVIKPEGTIPEYGGGLCQVSTTLYRAVLNANLPVVDRRPHSYAVSYYAQQMGDGLDATIYPGASDLRFENTTGSIIVLQAYNDGQQAYFKLYGKPQDIEVSYDGPYISNRIGAPAAVRIIDNNMPAGSSKQVEKAHNGFDVVWYKTTKFADGRTEKEEIFSRYKAIPAKFIVGPEGVESGELGVGS